MHIAPTLLALDAMKLRGKVLWLTDDAGSLARQLEGQSTSFSAREVPPLSYGVNTDLMISGAACTLGAGSGCKENPPCPRTDCF